MSADMADFIVSLLLTLTISAAWPMGWIFLWRERGNRKANIQYALLLLLFSLCVLDNLLAHAGLLVHYHEKYFIPIWYTLAIGPAFFFAIKFTLYPAYELRPTDAKHFILPMAQAFFYWTLYFSGPNTQELVWDNFLEPFFKTFEGILYVTLLFTYLALSYRYVKYKQAVVRKKGYFLEHAKTIWLQWTIKVLFALSLVNTSYIIMDFVVYNFLGWNLHSVKGFSYLGDLSFAAMLAWLVWRSYLYAFRVAYPTTGQLAAFYQTAEWTKNEPQERLFDWFGKDRVHQDPELNLRRLAFLSGLPPSQARSAILQRSGLSFSKFVLKKRLETYQSQMKDPKYQHQGAKAIALQAGFSSFRRLQKALKTPFV